MKSDRTKESGGHGERSRESTPVRDGERRSLESRGGGAGDTLDRGTSLSDRSGGSSGRDVGGGTLGTAPNPFNQGPKEPLDDLKEEQAKQRERNAEAEADKARLRALAGRRISG